MVAVNGSRPYNPQFELEEGWLTHSYQLAHDTLRFQSKDLRRERTGVHALVKITLNSVMLASTVFNVEKDEDRVRLSNSAYKMVSGAEYEELREAMPATWFKHALDVFCTNMWSEKMQRAQAQLLPGDLSKRVVQLVKGLVLDGGGTVVFAPPGLGKTTTLLVLAVLLDAGLSIPGVLEIARPSKVLFINLERSQDSLQYRLARVNAALGLPPERPLLFINERGKSLTDIYEGAARSVNALDVETVFLDSLSRAGGSLTEDDSANRTMDRLNALSSTWVLAGHTPRADTGHVFGSQMFDAAVDVAVQLLGQTVGATTGVGLQVTKENDLGPQPLRTLAYEWDSGGLRLVRAAKRGEFAEIEAGRRMSVEEEVYQLLLTQGQMTATKVAQLLDRNRSYIATLLAGSDRFRNVGRLGGEVFYGAKLQMELEGV